MDRSLDEIISERPRGGGRRQPADRRPPPPRGPRREEYPRDGVRKNRRDDRANLDTDWVHDRYEDDRFDRQQRRSPEYDSRQGPSTREPPSAEPGAKLRIDNLHYDLTEEDVHELFTRIGPIVSARLLYDRMDRSQGTAFVTYADPRDARQALREFDNANANGQPIRITLLPNGPQAEGRGKAPAGSLFDRVERPSKSLFERIGNGPSEREDGGRNHHESDGRRRGGRGGDRSYSPRKGGDRLRAPENVDRYIPGQRSSRSPVRRRGTPREAGRRPGARREDSGRDGRRRGKQDDEGRSLVGGRPRKTAEELDAEMADYWGSKADDTVPANGAATETSSAPAATANIAADDIDMIE